MRAFCDEVWPARDAAGLVHDLWTEPGRLARAARGILDDDEQALLRWRRRPGRCAPRPGPTPTPCSSTRWPGCSSAPPGYGHVVLDEAQDLSPMQCRAVARRLAAGSLTVLGDLAQATSPWSPSDWQETLAGLGRPDTVVRPLTRGYRVPGEVLDFANRLLPLIAPDLPAGDGGPLRARLAHGPAGVGARPGRWSRW